MSKKLIELGGFDTIPAISTGNLREDNIANAGLYRQLLKDGEKTGLYPFFVKKDYEFDYFWLRLSDRGVKDSETYRKSAAWLLEKVNRRCFEVWQGRMLYDYKLDCCENTKDYEEYMEDLILPVSDKYNRLFDNPREISDFGLFDAYEMNPAYAQKFIHFEDYIIVLLPITNPWEALAYFPMGSFNSCPSPECQIALAKELYDKYRARIMFIGLDRLTYYLEKPLLKRDELEAAAKTLIIADDDCYPDYELTVKEIIGKHTWQLWWD
ncbi:DUF4253 domain-containing protein [Butyrivibrio sp. XPD2006]|uniref:DUF4253 domain-containing protein n=1 Tax=Butyrivibrio sp. XPD2006 TaxID=1280668 RepID=UPI0003B5CAD9|nr:DUF4253 domain-containing protein [Butyrivibrio sp. XPD2006]